MKREYPRSGDEQDCVYAKNLLKIYNKPGIRKKTKKRMNKRFRKKGRIWNLNTTSELT